MTTDNKTDFSRKEHWEHVYTAKEATEVSWYQQHPETSLNLIKATGVGKSARIIDIGGGASTLVDFLLTAGYQKLTVLDISQSAIKHAKDRLGQQTSKVEWVEQDVTTFKTMQPFEVWHDRAVFHFLTEAEDRLSYVKIMSDALEPGAHAIVATFNLDGPEKCSGLDIVQYSPETLSAIFSEKFQLIETNTELHETPSSKSQSFVYCRFKKV